MRFRGFVTLLAAVVAAGCAYSVYAPETIEKLAPGAGAYARKLHNLLPDGLKAPAAAPAAAEANARPAPDEANARPPVLVSVAQAKRADYPVYLDSLGQVQAYNTVTVRTRVDGQVMKIAFEEGQMVRTGDLLAQIDPRPFQAALDQAKAKKSQDEANLANAKLDQQRYATLARQNFATQQQLDTQNALVAQLTAAIAADSASIDAAQVQLDYSTIRAPITGRVGFRLVDQGNIVAAAQQTGIVTIAQLEPISVVFTEPEQEVTQLNQLLAAGAPEVLAKSSDGSQILGSGKLILTDNQVDVATGSIRLKGEFANTDHKLWPGLAVATRLTVGDLKGAIVVPTEAIQHGPNGLFVYVVDDRNRAAMRPVSVTHQDLETSVVDKGVNEGDKVVTAGAYVLQPGSRVTTDATASSGS
jgi:multidrug efflux system membrane fusion protein